MENKETIYTKLSKVQSELIAPKGQYNNFGKYNYRSCEDILQAVKPLLLKVGAVILLEDTLEKIGERYYIKSTAFFISVEQGERIETTAYAREDENKKGMDSAQITGTASSYSRKYALNALLLIDDTKDSETHEYKKQIEEESRKEENTNTFQEPIFFCKQCGKQVSPKVATRSYDVNNGIVFCSKQCVDNFNKTGLEDDPKINFDEL